MEQSFLIEHNLLCLFPAASAVCMHNAADVCVCVCVVEGVGDTGGGVCVTSKSVTELLLVSNEGDAVALSAQEYLTS